MNKSMIYPTGMIRLKTMDFWPFAYYPFYMKMTSSGLAVEDIHEDKDIQKTGNIFVHSRKKKCRRFSNVHGIRMAGSGKDGDHNVFFLDNEQEMHHPLRYEELVKL